MKKPFKLDKLTILDSFGNDEEMFSALAEMFVQEAVNYAQALDVAIAEDDAKRLQREAHTLKSLFATFADEESAALARQLEQQSKLESPARLAPQALALCVRLQVLEEALRAELAKR